jgi:hypothetical protein
MSTLLEACVQCTNQYFSIKILAILAIAACSVADERNTINECNPYSDIGNPGGDRSGRMGGNDHN